MFNGDKGCGWHGTATLTSKLNPSNTITANIQPFRGAAPCGNLVFFGVTGGTGKFAHASGNGNVRFNCSSDGTYTDRWSGTLKY